MRVIDILLFGGRVLTCVLLLELCVALARDIMSGRIER